MASLSPFLFPCCPQAKGGITSSSTCSSGPAQVLQPGVPARNKSFSKKPLVTHGRRGGFIVNAAILWAERNAETSFVVKIKVIISGFIFTFLNLIMRASFPAAEFLKVFIYSPKSEGMFGKQTSNPESKFERCSHSSA